MAKEVFFIIPNSEIGGAQNFFKRLFNNFEVGNKELVIENRASHKNLNFLYRVFRIYRLISKSEREPVVFATVNSIVPSTFCRLFLKKFLLISRIGNTLSSEIKNNLWNFYKFFFLYRVIFKVADYVVFQSKAMKEDALKTLNLSNDSKYVVINNGVDFKEIQRFSLEKDKTEVDPEFLNFLLIGSFKFQKGYDIFFNALSLIPKDEMESMKFYICGGGQLLPKFQEEVIRMSFSNNIIFLGWIDNPYPLIRKMDSYILPSRYEGFPNSLIEALSFGLPSIVSRCPGANEEIISDNFNGITFKNENPKDLAKKIIMMKKNLEKFDSELIVQDIKNRYLIQDIANQYKHLIV